MFQRCFDILEETLKYLPTWTLLYTCHVWHAVKTIMTKSEKGLCWVGLIYLPNFGIAIKLRSWAMKSLSFKFDPTQL